MLLGKDNFFFRGYDAAQLFGFQIGIAATGGLRFEAIHYPFEFLMRHSDDNLAE